MRTVKGRRLRDLSIALGALVAAVLTVAVVVWINIGFLEAADRNDTEAREELAWGDTVRDAASDQENALHGLLATGDPRFIQPYEEGRARLQGALTRLTAYAANDPPAQRRDVAKIVLLARRWTESVADPRIAAVRSGRRLASDSAKVSEMAEIRATIDHLRALEVGQLHQRDATQAAAYGSSRLALVIGAAAALAFASLIIGFTARQLINERQSAEETAEELKAALGLARAGERTKTRFLANMSHEMRTPLNGVSGMTEALAHTRLDPGQREMVEAIRSSSLTLDQLIGDLLSLSRDGAVEPVEQILTAFHLGAAARAAAEPFAAQARKKGLGFALEIASEAEVGVVGDAPKLGELLACLLSNAVKFTDRGQVRLSLRGLGADRYAFEVADTGIGFDETTKAQMFETFVQSDDSDTRRYGGAGLGLALALRRTAELGGGLDAGSTPGEGAIFSFTIALPLAEEATAAPTTGSASFEPTVMDADEPQMSILIVDDHPTNRKVLELILDQIGVQWLSVEDGLQAVKAASLQTFAAILMDIQMPVMDGLTATREIRRLEREAGRPATPVIIVSANCQPEHVKAGLAAGAQRHLGKPVSVQGLLGALNEVFAELDAAA
jgi:signal transduction histidine kinase/ActR/RegA family two-component response regulator